MSDDRALFRSIEECLLWAYYYAQHVAGTVEEPSYSRMIKDHESEYFVPHKQGETAPKPRGYDASAQAGLIKSYIEGLPYEDSCHLKAAMLRTHERARAQHQMRDIVAGFIGEAIAEGLVYELVAKHYGKPGVSVLALSKKYRIDRRKVTGVRLAVELHLTAISYRAESRAYATLQHMLVVL